MAPRWNLWLSHKGCISGCVVKSSFCWEVTLVTTSRLIPRATFNDVHYNTHWIIPLDQQRHVMCNIQFQNFMLCVGVYLWYVWKDHVSPGQTLLKVKVYPDKSSWEEAISLMFFTSYFCKWRIATKKLTRKSYRNTNLAVGPINTSVLPRTNLCIGDVLRSNCSQHTCKNMKIELTGPLVTTSGLPTWLPRKKGSWDFTKPIYNSRIPDLSFQDFPNLSLACWQLRIWY